VSRDSTRTIYRPPWRIDVVRRNGLTSPLSAAAIARAVSTAVQAAHAPQPASVTVVLTNDEELADLNHEHMGHEGPTDVLSFPMLEPEVFVRTGFDDQGPRQKALPARSRRRVHIGDMAISIERATEQADEGRGGHTGDVRWSPADEMRLLVTHGTLHLCGWDHAEPREEAAMRALERRLLQA
jgi:probable rRNA maturation factor